MPYNASESSAAAKLPLRMGAPQFAAKKGATPLVVVTAYDAPQGRIADTAGVDAILVGDSVGMVTLGYDDTLRVTLDDILHHTKAVVRGMAVRRRTKEPTAAEVARGARQAMVIADLPFGTYGVTVEDGVRAGIRLVQEGGAHAVKLEGATPVICETITRLIEIGVPVMGHVGMTPQSSLKFGGFRMQGKTEAEGDVVLADAQRVAEAGVFGVVLEVIPAPLAARITQAIAVPTIGIGAGPDCDGQVQVWYDLLGLSLGGTPRHARVYADLSAPMQDAITTYANDVRNGK